MTQARLEAMIEVLLSMRALKTRCKARTVYEQARFYGHKSELIIVEFMRCYV